MSLCFGSITQGGLLGSHQLLRGSGLPSLPSPVSSLNLPSLQFFQVLWAVLHQVILDCYTQSNCGSFSGITLQCWQTRWYSLTTGLHHQPCLSVLCPLQQRTWAYFSPSGFGPESSSVSWSSTTVDGAVKVQLPFNFLDGNRFPWEWEWVMFDPPVVVIFESRGSLTSTHLSSFQAARNNLE